MKTAPTVDSIHKIGTALTGKCCFSSNALLSFHYTRMRCYICRIRQSKKRDELFFLCSAAASKFTSPFLLFFLVSLLRPLTPRRRLSLARSLNFNPRIAVCAVNAMHWSREGTVGPKSNSRGHGKTQKVSD